MVEFTIFLTEETNELSLKKSKVKPKKWILSMNKFKTVPEITFKEYQYAKKFPSNLDENENRARRGGAKSIQARKWRVKLPCIFKKKINFLIAKYKK